MHTHLICFHRPCEVKERGILVSWDCFVTPFLAMTAYLFGTA